MLQSKARWTVGQSNEEAVAELVSGLRLDPLIARMLVVRGIGTVERASRFLNAGREDFHDPYLLAGMEQAVERIRKALSAREKIRVYGDYDADGVSSTSLMIRLLESLEADFDYYIPHRVHEGYGLNRNALDLAKESGVSLIITVDTGISAKDEVAYAAELGIDVVVTDHHEPPEELPAACAVINPKQPGCPYPFKQLAGAGVALKLAHALLGRLPEELMELAAIGTVGDLMPLTDENRALVKLGLEQMKSTDNAGIRALLSIAGVEKEKVSSGTIGFALAPRINASGRLEGAQESVMLLTARDPEEAQRLALNLDLLNKERQRIVEEIVCEAMDMAQEAVSSGMSKVIVLAGVNWNVGVIGIVAAKILDRFYRPVIILSVNPETGSAKGSARSIPGFDIHRALTECSGLMEHFGGHQAAAGMTLPAADIPELQQRLNALAAEWLTDEDYLPVMEADLLCDLRADPVRWIAELDKMGPFGAGNPTPRFVFSGLQVHEKKTMGKEQQHLKLRLASGEQVPRAMEAVYFGCGHLMERISGTALVDVLGELTINEWNGAKRPQIVIKDIRIPELQVFDWRGAKDRDPRWSLLADRTGESSTPALMIFSEEGQKAMESREGFPGFAVMEADPGGSLTLPQAAEITLESIRDLVLYTMPQSMEQLSAAIGKLPGLERIYAVFRDLEGDESTSLPNREMFKQVYAIVRQEGGYGRGKENPLVYFSKRSGMSVSMVGFIMEVFEELRLIERTGTDYRCVPSADKRDLTTSWRYQRKAKRQETEERLIYSSAPQMSRMILDIVKR